MAVKEESSHWQLHDLLSSPKQHIIYYPSSHDIICLNTKSRERELLTTLNYEPRCLTAAKDWVCAGGDRGNFTSFYVGEGERPGKTDSHLELSANADARLPLVLQPSAIAPQRESPEDSQRSSPDATTPHVSKKVGSDVVNCITIWFPSESSLSQGYTDPVAVAALNDSTVAILSLHDSEILETLTYPDYVNRAVISPQGDLLVAICDDPFLYIHKRQMKQVSRPRFSSLVNEYEWVFSGRIQLEGQRPADKSAMRGSFAACFSNSGRYLAVATQYGVISVFLTELLTNDDVDPLVVSFTSSRPKVESGAVRAMEFSPNPFDLLAWTEANGRIGVADLRDMFISRQIIDIDSRGDGVERVWVTECSNDFPSREARIDARFRAFRTFRTESPSDASASAIPDYLGLDFDRQRLRSLTRDLTDRHQLPPTADEMEILQAHRMARQLRDAAREAQAQGSSSRWGTLDGERSADTSVTSHEGSGTAERRISTTGLPSALREFVNSDRTPASFRAFIDRQNQDRERRAGQNDETRQQISSVIDGIAVEGELNRSVGTSADTFSGLERLSLAPRLPTIGYETAPNAWAELEEMYRTRFPRDPQSTLQAEGADEESRAFAQRSRQPWRPLDALTRLSLDARTDSNLLRREREGRREPVDTMGLAWSEDSRLLYVGAGDGIHEYQVNVAGRKIFPHRVLQ
ncbi:hypothetical protein SBOR_4144 [Sclerotinia borealis F-4128]|uniref:DUF2415 domain-containing protein n=1 Tax=Sclerotinia borealis (strain F-4128) TaxID=1432307 RepID=W9CLU3_SCLBF|nr:hypothetical protein SBOR_4144 [Sclerotinia borealis F-4128]